MDNNGYKSSKYNIGVGMGSLVKTWLRLPSDKYLEQQNILQDIIDVLGNDTGELVDRVTEWKTNLDKDIDGVQKKLGKYVKNEFGTMFVISRVQH